MPSASRTMPPMSKNCLGFKFDPPGWLSAGGTKERGPVVHTGPLLQCVASVGLVVHPAATGHRGSLVLLGKVGDERLGGEDHRRDRRAVLHGRADDLDRVDDPGLRQ